jgi:putative inorganic carbon (hco3(-)) transporter
MRLPDNIIVDKKAFSTPIKGVILFICASYFTFVYIVGVVLRDSDMGIMGIGAAIAFLIGVMIFLRPQVGGYLLIMIIYTHISTILVDMGHPSILKPVLGLVLAGILAYYLLNKGTGIPTFKQVEWFFLLYVIVQLLTVLIARDRSVALARVEDGFKDLIILYCMIHAIHEARLLKSAIWIVAIVVSILAALGAYQALTGNYQQTFFNLAKTSFQGILEDTKGIRLAGPINRPNFWGQVLVAITPLTIYLFYIQKKLVIKAFFLCCTFIIIFASFYTYSRGAFVSLVITLGLIAYERRARIDLLILMGIGSVMFLQLLQPDHVARLQTLLVFTSDSSQVNQESSFKGRNAELQAGILMFTDSPLYGVGAGNYEPNYLDYARRIGIESRNEERQPHSLYFEILAETGLVGGVAFAVLITSLFIQIQQTRARLKSSNWIEYYFIVTALEIAIVSYLISSLFLHGAYLRFLWILVGITLSAIYTLNEDLDLKEANPSLAATAVQSKSVN